MSFFDFRRQLRTEEADTGKAARAMKVLGWICIVGGVWNYLVLILSPFKQLPVNIASEWTTMALMICMLLGGLFLLSARGITGRALWGRRLGQLTVALLAGAISGSFYFLFSRLQAPFLPPVSVMVIFSIIFLGQFVMPAYFGIRYLGRLPVDESSYVRPAYRPEVVTRMPGTGTDSRQPATVQRYKEAPVP